MYPLCEGNVMRQFESVHGCNVLKSTLSFGVFAVKGIGDEIDDGTVGVVVHLIVRTPGMTTGNVIGMQKNTTMMSHTMMTGTTGTMT